MSPKLAVIVLVLMLNLTDCKPVVKKLNFNLFLLTPKNVSENKGNAEKKDTEYVKSPVKVLFSTNGVSRFPPILEYIVQRIQGMFSVFVNKDQKPGAPTLLTNGDLQLLASTSANVTGVEQPPDTSENEVNQGQDDDPVSMIHGVDSLTGLPNVVVRPSTLHPGTYEVEISVAVDDGNRDDNFDDKHN